MDNAKADSEFGPIRSFLWPIHRYELKKFVPMFLMLFLVCFNYTVLRNMKDSILITAAGAEAIPFIKVWVVLPMAIVVTLIFTKLSNRYSQERVFYIIISSFLACYILFAFFIYPLKETLHPHDMADRLETLLPSGFKGMISMFRYWTLTVFYMMCELWSTMALTVLFWGFANEVTRISEARRFYGVFGIASNFAAIAAGQSAIFLSGGNGLLNGWTFFGDDPWEQTMKTLVLLITVCGLIAMGIFRWMNRNVLTDPSFDDLHTIKKEMKSKGKLSLRESIAFLSNSKYLICIAVLVVAYNLVINLGEVLWKDQLGRLYPKPGDFNSYVNNLTSIQGIVSTLSAFFMAKCIGKFGWTRTALVTPITILVTSMGFFLFIIFQDGFAAAPAIALMGTTPLAIAVFFGSAQNCLSKAAKYSFFDATKEMAFIPLSHESKLKGKAAIDGVGSRLGKSGGSLIHQGLLMVFTTLTVSAPYVGAILMGVVVFWIIAARSLGHQFNDLAKKAKKEGDVPAEKLTVVVEQPQVRTAL